MSRRLLLAWLLQGLGLPLCLAQLLLHEPPRARADLLVVAEEEVEPGRWALAPSLERATRLRLVLWPVGESAPTLSVRTRGGAWQPQALADRRLRGRRAFVWPPAGLPAEVGPGGVTLALRLPGVPGRPRWPRGAGPETRLAHLRPVPTRVPVTLSDGAPARAPLFRIEGAPGAALFLHVRGSKLPPPAPFAAAAGEQLQAVSAW
ncbi:MAG: hypothetical protein D6729_15180 [Deltaproteobacteria bacterium]|nr:MAG: hypothetical protein D6729_15180 [Deltaproteobacteria bacterium]